MPKYYKDKTNKKPPYVKPTSHVNVAAKDRTTVSDNKENRSKVSQTEALAEEPNICSQCQTTGRGLVQCECCDLWYCYVCCGISEEALVLLSEAECLHFFCPPCKGEVFNLVNKKTVNLNSSSNDIVSTVTDTISKAIRDLQAAM